MARTRLRRFFRHGLLPQLLAFETVIRLGSVTRAAEELCLAQPTVSCMLRKLSEAMGGPVTVIRERRVEASALGCQVLVLCRDFLQAMERFAHRQPGTLGYDPQAEDAPASPPDPLTPWPSPSRPDAHSRSRQRASLCRRAKRRLSAADGVS
jgi:hypothetical protein